MNVNKKDKIIKLLKIWGNSGIIVKNYKMEFKEIMQICKDLRDVRALCYENMSESKNKKIVSTVENTALKTMDFYENRMESLNKRLRENTFTKERMETYIKRLDANEQAILRAKYVEKIKWEQVPARLVVGCSLRQCYRSHDAALEKLGEMVDDELMKKVE